MLSLLLKPRHIGRSNCVKDLQACVLGWAQSEDSIPHFVIYPPLEVASHLNLCVLFWYMRFHGVAWSDLCSLLFSYSGLFWSIRFSSLRMILFIFCVSIQFSQWIPSFWWSRPQERETFGLSLSPSPRGSVLASCLTESIDVLVPLAPDYLIQASLISAPRRNESFLAGGAALD
jgi:hypothetical protein